MPALSFIWLFWVDAILKGEKGRDFPQLAEYMQSNRLAFEVVRTNLMQVEKAYRFTIPEAEVAHIYPDVFGKSNQ
jgi:transcriptional regulatory protein LevR